MFDEPDDVGLQEETWPKPMEDVTNPNFSMETRDSLPTTMRMKKRIPIIVRRLPKRPVVSVVRTTRVVREVKTPETVPSMEDLPILSPFGGEIEPEEEETVEVVDSSPSYKYNIRYAPESPKKSTTPFNDNPPTSLLRAQLASARESNMRLRKQLTLQQNEIDELRKGIEKAERIIERDMMDKAAFQTEIDNLKRLLKDLQRRNAETSKHRRRVDLSSLVPSRCFVFSESSKQVQCLRMRVLNRLLTDLAGPAPSEKLLEEKNMMIFRWRKAHLPRTSVDIGRQLTEKEEAEFCSEFGIDDEKKKGMRKFLAMKGINLFPPSHRALQVRRWRKSRREKGAQDEATFTKEDEDEAGEDSDGGSLTVDDIREAEEGELIVPIQDEQQPIGNKP